MKMPIKRDRRKKVPKANWPDVPDYGTFEPIPSDDYEVEVTKVEKKQSRANGTDYWSIELTITEGEYAGRKLWDSLSFIGKDEQKTKYALQRVKLVAHRLGNIKLDNDDDFNPEVLLGKKWKTMVIKELRPDRNGVKKEQNTIPFDGYHKRDDDQTPDTDDDLPF